MRSKWTVLASLTYAQSQSQTRICEPPYLWDVLKEQETVKLLQSAVVDGFRAAHPGPFRLPEDCRFPLDVVILQDATESFDDNIAAMRDTQVDLIYSGITSKHPDSRFAVVSFKDKPIEPLGNRDDYCSRFDAALTSNATAIKEAYGKIVAYGGYDAPENQFGTLYNVLATSTVGWSTNPQATKLVVISTDAGPHFAGDSNTGLLPPFDSAYVQDENKDQCLARYYPTPAQVKARVLASKAYVASLVYDGTWADNWPSKSWLKFNSFIGQSDDFVATQAPDSSDFWEKLATMVAKIESIECGIAPTLPPAPSTLVPPITATSATLPPAPSTLLPPVTASLVTLPPPTLVPPVTAGTAGTPQTTVVPSTATAVGTPLTQLPTDSQTPCECPCTDCNCCPEVVIRLQHRPNSLHLDVVN